MWCGGRDLAHLDRTLRQTGRQDGGRDRSLRIVCKAVADVVHDVDIPEKCLAGRIQLIVRELRESAANRTLEVQVERIGHRDTQRTDGCRSLKTAEDNFSDFFCSLCVFSAPRIVARMIYPTIRREIAERYHRALPEDIRAYLKGRGIPSTIIERQLLGWNGERITVPIFNREREVLGFQYAKSPRDTSDAPAMRSDIGLDVELYGWEALARHPHRVVIAANEFDRLVLEANGFPAVASTAGAGAFLEEWLPYFEPVKHIYVCFGRDLRGSAAARKIQRLLEWARIVTLPPEVGETGTVTDYFVELGRTKIDFEVLLAAAEGSASDTRDDVAPNVAEFRPLHKSVRRRAERARRAVRLHDVVAQTTDLQASGASLVAHCPFHDDHDRSFTIHPSTDTYACSGCGARGDVVQFLMDKEAMTIGQALEALERFQFTHELYGAS